MCILLVDDEPTIRLLVSEVLEDAGFSVEVACNGDEAADMIAADPSRFTALITDFHMPGRMNGSQVAAAMRQHRPGIPVIIISGRHDVLKASWRSDHGYSTLCKPFGLRELLPLLEQAIRCSR